MTAEEELAQARAKIAALEAEAAALRQVAGPTAEVTLAGRAYRLVQIGSLADRWSIVINFARPGREEFAAWAALGLMIPEMQQRGRYNGDLLQFGRAVANLLLSEGVTMGELNRAARAAYDLAVTGLVSVDGAQDFSGTPSAGSGDGGGSSGGS